MTHKILTKDSLTIIPRVAIHSAAVVRENNLWLNLAGGETPDLKPIIFIKDKADGLHSLADFKPMASFDPNDLLGRTFMKNAEENGE